MEFIISIGVNIGQVLTGGVIVLHKLAYELANRGYKVTIFTKPEYPHPNINVEHNSDENNLNFDFNKDKTVIVPSIDWKNTIGIKNVARWVLYHVDENQLRNVDDTDEIFNFGTFDIPNKNVTKKLTIFDYKDNIFYNQKKIRNKKYCYITNKNHPNNWKEVFDGYGADNITNWKTKGWEYLANMFNQYEYFLTYDDKSTYTLLASLCGTKSIILGNNKLSPMNYRLKNPIQLFGVAYGIDDLKWAEKTINLVPYYVEELKKEDNQTIDYFIKFWENKIL